MNNKIINCPRCLGKGFVNKEDIKRLRREFFWIEGPHCAFCDGKKHVKYDFANRFNADDWYITSDLDKGKFQRYLNEDEEILNEIRHTEQYVYYFGNYIMEHHVSRGLSKEKVIASLARELQIEIADIREDVDGMIEQIKTNILNVKPSVKDVDINIENSPF
jgi:hypothetical protein|tara:strand:- start:97 stop:582 length:486 start_codon:yes stop_codon:yes gene_type:complete